MAYGCNNLSEVYFGNGALNGLRCEEEGAAAQRPDEKQLQTTIYGAMENKSVFVEDRASMTDNGYYITGARGMFKGCKLSSGSVTRLSLAMPTCVNANGDAVEGVIHIGLDADIVPQSWKDIANLNGGVLPQTFFNRKYDFVNDKVVSKTAWTSVSKFQPNLSESESNNEEYSTVVLALQTIFNKGWKKINLDWH